MKQEEQLLLTMLLLWFRICHSTWLCSICTFVFLEMFWFCDGRKVEHSMQFFWESLFGDDYNNKTLLEKLKALLEKS